MTPILNVPFFITRSCVATSVESGFNTAEKVPWTRVAEKAVMTMVPVSGAVPFQQHWPVELLLSPPVSRRAGDLLVRV